MAFRGKDSGTSNTIISGAAIEQVSHFSYLGMTSLIATAVTQMLLAQFNSPYVWRDMKDCRYENIKGDPIKFYRVMAVPTIRI